MAKLLSLIHEKQQFEDVSANMVGTLGFTNMVNLNNPTNCHRRWIVDSRATQHMTSSTDGLSNILNVSDLQMHVDHCHTPKSVGGNI